MRKGISFLVLAAFFINACVPPSWAQALMPEPGQMVALSPAFRAPVLTGVKVYADEPFRLDFILDPGEVNAPDVLDAETNKLIKYFLASLTVPEGDLWVNLSPYEKERIVPDAFGLTEMGRDLLAQDYLLKQVTSSLMYPEDQFGREFWSEVYERAQAQFGTTDIPLDTFNKVWIVPSKAVVYERPLVAGAAPLDEAVAYVVESRLKVMLESDYTAMSNNLLPTGGHVAPQGNVSPSRLPSDLALNVRTPEGSSESQAIAKDVIRRIIIPVLEKEVNEGRNFAALRQVYHSLILASWYKKKIRQSLLSSVYVDQKKVRGVNIDDPKEAEKIWARYVEAFKKGVFDLIREEEDRYSQEMVPRKYFSGGVTFMAVDAAMDIIDDAEDMKARGMITPEEAFLIRMNLRAEPPDGDMPEGNPVFFPQEQIYQRIINVAPRLKDIFSEYGFGSGPEVMASFGKVFKAMLRREVLDMDELFGAVSEQLSEERALFSSTPGYLEESLTTLLGVVSSLLKGYPVSSYGQLPEEQIAAAGRLMKRWVGTELDPGSVFYDRNIDWRGTGNFRNSRFIQMTIVPVQYGVSVPVVLHESMHHMFRGFDATWIDEAVTQRLSLEMLDLERAGIPGSFQASYQKEQRMLRMLADAVGGYAPIILAYAEGDMRALFRALGPHAGLAWRLMEALDDIDASNPLKPRFLEAILKNLDSRDALVRLGDIIVKHGAGAPVRVMPLLARALKKPFIRSVQAGIIREEFLQRPVTGNILLERSISAYVEGFSEKDFFTDEEDIALLGDDLAQEAVFEDRAEAMPLLERLNAFMKMKNPNAVPMGVDGMKFIVDALHQEGSPLAVYKTRMAEYLKEEDLFAFKLAPERPEDPATILKIYLSDEDLFNGRPWEKTFDAPVLNSSDRPVMVTNIPKAFSHPGQHWRWDDRSAGKGHWSDWDPQETVSFTEQIFLEGKPRDQQEVDAFIMRLKEQGYKPVLYNWDLDDAPIRCSLDDQERKFYLMDPRAVKKDKAEASSLPAVLDGYNAIEAIAGDLARMMNDPDVLKEAERSAPDVRRARDNYRHLGAVAGFDGRKVVYNPFGGADVLAPFSLAGDATDVVSMGFEDFGSSAQARQFFTEAGPELRTGGALTAYDNQPKFYQETSGAYGGIGPLAMARIIFQLKGEITAVHFFDITSDGDIVFIQQEGQESGKSAVVEFNITDENGIVVPKRFWYVQHDVYAGHALGVSNGLHKNPISLLQSDVVTKGFVNGKGIIARKFFDDRQGFLEILRKIVGDGGREEAAYEMIAGMHRSYVAYRNFISRLPFDALLIKAALHMWSDYGAGLVAELTLDPAIKNGAVVLSDQKSRVLDPQDIWDDVPEPYALKEGESLGYSRSGGNIFYGPASRLRSSEDYAEIAAPADAAETGGIDLTPERMRLETTGSATGLAFDLDPVEVRRLQQAPGFIPVIMDVQPMNDLPEFLGLTAQLN